MPGSFESRVATAQIERPREAAASYVRPMNALERWLLPQAAGIMWPWGRISLNRPLIEQSELDPGDVTAHELVHVGQQQREGLLPTLLRDLVASRQEYLARPHEQEALEAEARRPIRRHDIRLPDSNTSVRTALRKQVDRGR